MCSSSNPQSPDHMDLCQWKEESRNILKESYSRRKTINWPFRKSSSTKCIYTTVDGSTSPIKISLRKLCGPEMSVLCKDQITLIPPLINLLKQLYIKGPSTVGIFRKSANTRICRELKMKLEENPEMDLDDYPVTAIASVFKELIRCLPDGLLEKKYLDDWMAVITNSATEMEKMFYGILLNNLMKI
uniref:Rho-GAP domain-containing protein n=1 Tax=Tetranychus urticae TaxID=32264 RepID=T1KIM3_TETUR